VPSGENTWYMASFIEPLYKLAVLDSMSGIGCQRRRFQNLTTYVDCARGKGSHLADAVPRADIRSAVLPSLQADVFDALELDPKETSATLSTPGGGGGKCGPHGAGRGGKTGARYPSLSRLDNRHCNFWIVNGEADFSTFNCGSPQARRSCTGSGKGGRCWHQPACRPRP
jgi:hypothetical protein